MTLETEALEADIARQRAALAETVDELQARMDVRSRAREKAYELKERATTDTGRPRPGVAAAATGGVGVLAALLRLKARRSGHHRTPTEGSMHMHKLTWQPEESGTYSARGQAGPGTRSSARASSG